MQITIQPLWVKVNDGFGMAILGVGYTVNNRGGSLSIGFSFVKQKSVRRNVWELRLFCYNLLLVIPIKVIDKVLGVDYVICDECGCANGIKSEYCSECDNNLK